MQTTTNPSRHSTMQRHRRCCRTKAPLCRSTPSAAPQCQPTPADASGMTDAEAILALNRLRCGSHRSDFAKALFPYDRQKYGSHGSWARDVGKRVARDIHANAPLRLALERVGYQPGKKGYTLEQRIILIKFYNEK